MFKFFLRILIFTITCSSPLVDASTVNTFDTETSTLTDFQFDSIDGDQGTKWESKYDSHGGRVFFDSFLSPNSITIKDKNNTIEAFSFWGYDSYYDSRTEDWMFTFYDNDMNISGTYAVLWSRPVMETSLNLISLGIYDVSTIQLQHYGGWMSIDNVRISENLASVPVPSAIWLMGSGIIGLMGVARKKIVT